MLLISTIFSTMVAKNEKGFNDFNMKSHPNEITKKEQIKSSILSWGYFSKCYGSLRRWDEKAYCVAQTRDGGYIVGGDVYGNIIDNTNIFIMKMNEIGSIVPINPLYPDAEIWHYDTGFENSDHLESISEVELSPGQYGYIGVGWTKISGIQNIDILVILWDETGNVLWSSLYDVGGADLAYAIKPFYDSITKEPNYIIAGFTNVGSTADGLILCLGPSGNIINERYFDSGGNEYFNSIDCIYDGPQLQGFALAGYHREGYFGEKDALLMKIDTNLNKIWAYEYGIIDCHDNKYNDIIYDVKHTSEGGFIMVGDSMLALTDSTRSDMLVIKTFSDGSLQWEGFYTQEDPWTFARSVEEAPDGRYMITGFTGVNLILGIDLVTIKLESDGSFSWPSPNVYYAGSGHILTAGFPDFPCNTYLNGNDYGYSIIRINDGFIIVGYTDSPEIVPTGPADVILCKFKDDGTIYNKCCINEFGINNIFYDYSNILTIEPIDHTTTLTNLQNYELGTTQVEERYICCEMIAFDMEIKWPLPSSISIFDIIKIPLDTTNPYALIIGPVTIEVEIYSEDPINRVEFYIDDILKETDFNKPYDWFWAETSFHEHTIKVIAFDELEEEIGSDTVEVLKFF